MLGDLDVTFFEQINGVRVIAIIVEIMNFFNAGLNNDFRAIITREVRLSLIHI